VGVFSASCANVMHNVMCQIVVSVAMGFIAQGAQGTLLLKSVSTLLKRLCLPWALQ
jgi:hypothetical protein